MPQVHAFFDFDDTLLHGDSILYWQRWYYRHRPLRRPFQLLNWAGLGLFALKLIDGQTLKRIYLLPMAYEKPEALDALARDFVREDLARRFHKPILERLWAHHLLGHKIVVISASATFYLKHLKSLLPMAEILGSEMLWNRKGLWRLPRYQDGNLRGANKLVRLKALGFGDRAPLSFAYSDHHHDAFLLGFAEFGYAVRPTRKLKAIAEEKSWPVLDWPRTAPKWREKLHKALLLILATGPASDGSGPNTDPAHVQARAHEFLPSETQSLRQRVAGAYSEASHPEVFKTVFGS